MPFTAFLQFCSFLPCVFSYLGVTETDSKEFHENLDRIRSGVVPQSMAEVVGYCNKTTLELREFTGALAECVYRQDRQLKLLGEIVKKLEAAVMRKEGAQNERSCT